MENRTSLVTLTPAQIAEIGELCKKHTSPAHIYQRKFLPNDVTNHVVVEFEFPYAYYVYVNGDSALDVRY